MTNETSENEKEKKPNWSYYCFVREETWSKLIKRAGSLENLKGYLDIGYKTIVGVGTSGYKITPKMARKVIARINEISSGSDPTYDRPLWPEGEFKTSDLIDYEREDLRLPTDDEFYVSNDPHNPRRLHCYSLTPDREGLGDLFWLHTEFILRREKSNSDLSKPGLLQLHGAGANSKKEVFHVSATLVNPFVFSIFAAHYTTLPTLEPLNINDVDIQLPSESKYAGFQLTFNTSCDGILAGFWTGIDHGGHAAVFRAFLSQKELSIAEVEQLSDKQRLLCYGEKTIRINPA